MSASGTHDHLLVALSVVVAAAASYTALDLASRVRAARGWTRRAWLATAAVAMGGGIWSMHFVAMLAFSMPGMEVSYDTGLTLLSLLIAIGATGLGFSMVNLRRSHTGLLAASGLSMGLGIAAMHYTGMAAMRMQAHIANSAAWVALAILIAIGAATVALWLGFRSVRPYSKIAAAVVMGCAVSGMHYAAMQGSVFHAHGVLPDAPGDANLDQMRLALAVATATFVILFLASVAAMFDRRFAVLAEREALALRESEERFRGLYRMTPLPLHSLDASGHIQQVSDAWIDLLGYPREQVIGRALAAFMAEPDGQRFLEENRARAADRRPPGEIEARFVTRDGALRDVVLSSRATYDATGRLVGVLGGLVDVTERKRAEEALRQAQKIEALGQLTGGVAHDFNNLLAVVMGNLELLRKRLPDDERALRLLDNAVAGAKRGAALTQRLLAFARRQDLKPEPVSIATLVHGMADLLQRAVGTEIRIDAQFPLHLPRAEVDANQLELALLNLAVNARDAMPRGGTITLAAEHRWIGEADPSGLAPGPYLCVSVADTGEGMDEATLARAREPFFTTKGLGKGTGLGLSMVHGLAEQSRGKLRLRSARGTGTVAEIWLPASTASEAAAPPDEAEAEAAATPLGRRLTILVVDDDALVLTNTAEMLEDLGHRALQAASAREALDLFGTTARIDLLITDHAMPGMTGAELVPLVRAQRPDLPIILASGYADVSGAVPTDVVRLRKPFSQTMLRQAIGGRGDAPEANVVRFAGRAL